LSSFEILFTLSQLVSNNEDLEKQLLTSKCETKAVTSSDTTHLEDEIRRLQAQNAALQKNVTSTYMIENDG